MVKEPVHHNELIVLAELGIAHVAVGDCLLNGLGHVFDFGRSKVGSGPFSFKKNWGFEPQSIRHEFRVKGGAEPAEINPLNPKYRLFIAAWKRLPLPVANLLGPQVVRHIG